MRLRFVYRTLLGACLCVHVSSFAAADEAASSDMEARFAAMEARILELEARLAESEKEAEQVEARLAETEKETEEVEARLATAEQETKEVKVLATNAGGAEANPGILGSASFDILADSAWRNLRWTVPEQWDAIREGISEEEVIEALGPPPRSVKSVKPRVDLVFYYETSLRDRSNTLRGRVSFRNGKVIAFEKPDFG